MENYNNIRAIFVGSHVSIHQQQLNRLQQQFECSTWLKFLTIKCLQRRIFNSLLSQVWSFTLRLRYLSFLREFRIKGLTSANFDLSQLSGQLMSLLLQNIAKDMWSLQLSSLGWTACFQRLSMDVLTRYAKSCSMLDVRGKADCPCWRVRRPSASRNCL